MKRFLIAAGLLCLILAGGAARAAAPDGKDACAPPSDEGEKIKTEDLDLKDLLEDIEVEAVSKFIQRRNDAPANVTVVTREDIESFGYRTLADILASIPGFFADNDRNYSFMGARGLSFPGDYCSRILLLVNGHCMSNPMDWASAVGGELGLEIDDIESIEIVRGPGSVVHGPSSLYGVVNIKTFTGEGDATISAAGSAGNFGYRRGRAEARLRSDRNAGIWIGISAMDVDGPELYYREFDDPSSNGGITSGTDGEDYWKIFSHARWGNLSFQTLWNVRAKGLPTGAYGSRFNDPDNATEDSRDFAELSYGRAFGDRDRFRLDARSYYDSYHYFGRYDYLEDDESESITEEFYDARWLGVDARIAASVPDANTVMLGANVERSLDAKMNGWYGSPEDVYLDVARELSHGAIYASDHFRVGKRLAVEGSVRYDDYDILGGAASDREALILYPIESQTVKLVHSKGLRAPALYELYYRDGFSMVDNPDLAFEQMQTFEAVVEQWIGARVLVSIAGFRYQIRDLIAETIVPNPWEEGEEATQFQNLNSVTSNGVEAGADVVVHGGVRFRAGVSYQRARDDDSNEIPNSPEWLGNASLRIPFLSGKSSIGLRANYVGERLALDGTPIEGFVTADATVFARDLWRRIGFSFSVYNLFDEEYSSVAHGNHLQSAIVQDGRTARLTIGYGL